MHSGWEAAGKASAAGRVHTSSRVGGSTQRRRFLPFLCRLGSILQCSARRQVEREAFQITMICWCTVWRIAFEGRHTRFAVTIWACSLNHIQRGRTQEPSSVRWRWLSFLNSFMSSRTKIITMRFRRRLKQLKIRPPEVFQGGLLIEESHSPSVEAYCAWVHCYVFPWDRYVHFCLLR